MVNSNERLRSLFSAIADSIRSKTGETGTINATKFPEAIDAIKTGGSGATASAGWNDVTFIDYDGTVLHSYSFEEVRKFTKLPELPSHERLVCQGWNWTLSNIKAMTSPVTVGANYITDDGATRLHIRISNTSFKSVSLFIIQSTSTLVKWGDGSTSTISGSGNVTIQHSYNNIGDYVISIIPGSSSVIALGHQSSSYCVVGSINNVEYLNMLQSVFIGERTAVIDYSFYNCYSLKNITFPSSYTQANIYKYAFANCYSLKSYTIPTNTTTVMENAFRDCRSLASIAFPYNCRTIQSNVFYNCYSLDNVSLPPYITSIYPSTFYSCGSLKTVTFPHDCNSIAPNAFQNCYSLQKVIFRSPTGAKIYEQSFADCYTMRCYDFSASTQVPYLSSVNGLCLRHGCQILVPSSLYSSWKSATNWSTYASYMVAV